MRTMLMITVCALILVGCGQKAEEQTADTQEIVLESADNQLLAAASGALIQKFGKQLKSELMSAMNEGGPINAINVCQVKAPEIARASVDDHWNIKRVSDRNRNPDNLANESETAILTAFADTTGNTPEFSFEWVEGVNGKTYRYYKPIYLAPLCVKCHGTADEIDPQVMTAIKDKYPNDRATGYAPGDLRGMFVVEAKWPEGKPFAESIVADSL